MSESAKDGDRQRGRPGKQVFRSLILFLLIASFFLLSFRSGYALAPASDINLDIALMLTPWGMLENFVLVQDSVLRPYYFVPTSRQGVFADPVLALLILAIGAQAFRLLFLLRKREG